MKFIMLVFFFGAKTAQAVLFFFDVPGYRGVGDSAFAGLDEFYLEDFEDGLLNTPNVSAPDGFVKTTGDVRSVDGDDGVIDGISKSFGAFASNLPIPAFHIFNFVPDEFGRYPNFVGIAVTHEFNLRNPIDSFSAISGSGGNLPNSQDFLVADLVGASGDLGNVEHAPFVGLYWSEGISRFAVSRALQVDHLQYSYAVPEPGVALFGAWFVLYWFRRRKRTMP